MISPGVRSVVHFNIVSLDLSTISSPESSPDRGLQLETPNIKKNILAAKHVNTTSVAAMSVESDAEIYFRITILRVSEKLSASKW